MVCRLLTMMERKDLNKSNGMKFITFKKFNEKETSEALAAVLHEQGIEFELVEDRESLDSLYGDKHFSKQFLVKIKQIDFAKADLILQVEGEKEMANVDKDHYLYEFTDEELFEILSKPDEWSVLDYQLSRKILQERGKEINSDTIELLKKQRIREMAKPEESQPAWVYAGYVFALLGGLVGIFIGLHLCTHKKTLPDGQRVYGHTKSDRDHGMRILIVGMAMCILWLVVRISRFNF